MRKWPGLGAVGGPSLPMYLWAPAQPSRSCQTLWKAAEICLGISKAQEKPYDDPQGSRAPYGPRKAWQKPRDTERQQGSLQGKAKLSKSPRALWREARPLVGMIKAIR